MSRLGHQYSSSGQERVRVPVERQPKDLARSIKGTKRPQYAKGFWVGEKGGERVGKRVPERDFRFNENNTLTSAPSLFTKQGEEKRECA